MTIQRYHACTNVATAEILLYEQDVAENDRADESGGSVVNRLAMDIIEPDSIQIMAWIQSPYGTNHWDLYHISMSMLTHEDEPDPTIRAIPPGPPGRAGRIALLSERQISYLRLVQQNHTSKEIAQLDGTSYRAVDKQLQKANIKLGTATRLEAVRLLAEYEKGVDSTYPVLALPSPVPAFPLPPVLPNAKAAANMLTWKQAAIWTAIISIGTPVALTVAGMAFVTLGLLLGMKTP